MSIESASFEGKTKLLNRAGSKRRNETKTQAVSVPVVVPDLILDAESAEMKRLTTYAKLDRMGGRWIERTKTSAERGSGRIVRKDDTFRVFSSLINSAHGPRSLSDAKRGWGSHRAYKAPAGSQARRFLSFCQCTLSVRRTSLRSGNRESVLNQAEVGEEQNNPNRIDDATIFELEDVRGVGGDLKTAGDNRTVSRKAGEEK